MFPGYYFSLPANAYLQDVSPFGATTTTTETKTTTAGTPTVSDNTLALVATNEYGEYDRRTLSFYGLEMLIEVRKCVYVVNELACCVVAVQSGTKDRGCSKYGR